MPDTMIFLIAGYGVIFGVLILYFVSLWIRCASVMKEQRHVADGLIVEQSDEV